jgi:hypothetical protein
MIKQLCLPAIAAIICFSCSSAPEKPEEIIPENDYVDLIVEMQLIRSYAENADTDSTTVDSLISEIYNKYGITGQQFQQNHHYYQQFPGDQKKRVERAIEKLKMELITEGDTTSNIQADSLAK